MWATLSLLKYSIFLLFSFFFVETHTPTNFGCSCVFITRRLSFIAAGKKWAEVPAVGQQQAKPKSSSPSEGLLQRTGIGDSAVLAQHLIRSDQFCELLQHYFTSIKMPFPGKKDH